MKDDPEYVQLSSWDEFITWIERAQERIYGKGWTPPKTPRKKKAPPQKEGLF